MLMASTQMLIACWCAYISLAQNKNRSIQKFVEVKKKNVAGPEWTQLRTPVAMLQIAACFAYSQPRDINWSCEIRELRSFHCLENFLFLFSISTRNVNGWLYFHFSDEKWRPSKLAKPNRYAWIRWQYIVLFWNISWWRRDLYFQRYLEGSFHCLPLLWLLSSILLVRKTTFHGHGV